MEIAEALLSRAPFAVREVDQGTALYQPSCGLAPGVLPWKENIYLLHRTKFFVIYIL